MASALMDFLRDMSQERDIVGPVEFSEICIAGHKGNSACSATQCKTEDEEENNTRMFGLHQLCEEKTRFLNERALQNRRFLAF